MPRRTPTRPVGTQRRKKGENQELHLGLPLRAGGHIRGTSRLSRASGGTGWFGALVNGDDDDVAILAANVDGALTILHTSSAQEKHSLVPANR